MKRTHFLDLRTSATRMTLVALVITLLLAATGFHGVPAAGSEESLADHPLVGTWVVDPEDNDPTNPPSFTSYMADGTMVNIGSDGASVGSWDATGPRTATMTFTGLVLGQPGAYFIIRGNLEVDESGTTFTGDHSFTMLSADGTVIVAAEGDGGSGVRIQAEPAESGGQGLPGFPTWTPASPEAATPEG